MQKREAEKVETHTEPHEKRQMAHTFKRLKALLLKQGTVYDLPWYLVMGDHNAGKTQFLREAELRLAYQSYHDPAQRNASFHWVLAEEGLFFDLPADFCVQQNTEGLFKWKMFLKYLKKARRRRPINGLILAVSLPDLLAGKLQEWQDAMRMRLDELQQKLALKVSVYLMLTGIDVIPGFKEFTLRFTEAERREVLGLTFATTENTTESMLAAFSAYYARLVASLNSHLRRALNQDSLMQKQSSVYYFPMQMAALEAPLLALARTLFAEHRYFQAGSWRGLYFISNGNLSTLQYDVILDEAILDSSAPSKALKSRRYFSEGLLRRVILKETDWIGVHAVYERHFKLWDRLKLSLLLGSTAALVFTWGFSLLKYQSYNAAIATYLQTDPAQTNLAAISNLYHAETDGAGSTWLHLGLWDRPASASAVSAVYQQSLIQNFLPGVLADLHANLQSATTAMQQSQNSMTAVENLYEALSTYLMFNQLNELNPTQITTLLQAQFNSQFPGDVAMQQTLDTRLQDLLKLGFPAQNLDQNLVQTARLSLWNTPVYMQAYLLLKLNALATPDNLTLTAANFTSGSVPTFFSRDGYNTIYSKQAAGSLNQVAEESWVFGPNYHAQYSAADLQTFQGEMDALYWTDYLNAWGGAIAAVNVMPFQSLQQASDTLSVLSKPDSPILTLLGVVLKNSDYGPTNIVTNANLQLASLVAPVPGKDPAIKSVMTSLGALQQYVSNIADSANPNLAAYNAATAIFAGQTDPSLTAITAAAATAPPPLSRWLNQIVANTESAIFAAANQYLSTQWQATVVASYQQTLAGRFPFTASSSEVSLEDFSNFFKPAGIEDSFVKKYLSPFLTATPSGQMAWGSINALPFSTNAAIPQEVSEAAVIRNTFFGSSNGALNFTLSPLDTSGTGKVLLAYDGKTLTISGSVGPGVAMTWPPQNTDGSVSLTFHRILLSDSTQNYLGPWGLFRLLQASTLVRSKYGSQYAVTTSDDGMSASFSLSAGSVENPFDLRLLRGYVCPNQF